MNDYILILYNCIDMSRQLNSYLQNFIQMEECMFAENLKKFRQDKGLSVEKLANIIDTPAATIWGYEGNKRTPSVDFPILLNRKFDLNINWFLTGEGPMYINYCDNSHFFINNNAPIENFKNWGKRLSQILTENEETPYNFAKRTGISESRIEKFILDSAEPTISELNKIKSNVAVSIDWLLYGENIEQDTQTEKVCLSADEIIQIKKLLKNSSI